MEERIVYRKKKSTVKTVAIVILVLLLISALTYIGYEKYIEMLNNKNKEEEHSREEMYYSEVSQIMDQIDMYNNVFKSIYPIENISTIDNQLKLQFGVYALKEIEKINNYYKIDDIKEMYNNYFINGFKAIYENIECPSKDGNLYILNNDNKTYIVDDSHGHGKSTMDTNTYYLSSKIDNNKYIINTHILYSNYCTDTCNPNGGYYKTYSECIKGEKPVAYTEKEYDTISEELPITTFTFIKEKSLFKLQSVKIN